MSGFDLVAGLARGFLCEADAGDLRPAIGAGRDVAGVERVHVIDAGDVLDADHSLVHRLVREPRWADHIAARVAPGLAGAQPFIDEDVDPLVFYPGPSEAARL